ncbi:MAG: hypothetical protein PF481_04965 [Bacteroidales bacterium]|jgi:hypothetical protein|nr:hypothetical protein [Bacteroidales bacterium]
MKINHYLILLFLIYPIISYTQNISEVSSKYNFTIYSKKGKVEKIAQEKRDAEIKKVKEERNLAFKNASSKNTIEAYDQFLHNKYSDAYLNNQAIESILLITPNTIAGYEQFLEKKYSNNQLNNQAIASIYKLTTQIDAVEGYRDFLNKYPNALDAGKATKRLYEIIYAIAEEENDIASYYGFLVQFPKAQVLLRDKAYINMQMLEVEKATNKFNEDKKGDDDHELKERVARQLYIEAIRAKESGDEYTFMRKYNTVLYSDLFKDTQAAFDLFRDKELASLIRELRDEIRNVNYSVNRMTSAITSKLNDIQNDISNLETEISSSQAENDYSSYYERIIDLQREQASDWSKYVNTGKGPKSWIGSPKSY